MNIENKDDSDAVYISAKTGYGLDALFDKIEEIFAASSRTVDAVIPYTSGDLINRIHNEAQVISESFEEGGTHIVAQCPEALAGYIESEYAK